MALVLEGYTLRYEDEVTLIAELADEVSVGASELWRVQVRPPYKEWNTFRATKRSAKGRDLPPDAPSQRYEQKMAPARPVAGVTDRVVSNAQELRGLLDDEVKVRRHKWYQSFELGPISTKGPSDAREKIGVVLDRDLNGKSVLDICSATGVHSFIARHRGARTVVGVEHEARKYGKALELAKTLNRHSAIDVGRVQFKLGDALGIVPALDEFDTVLFFGAIHYFPDYASLLHKIAAKTRQAAYIEFTFSEREHDTSSAPGYIRAWVRRSGNTIYMGDRDTIEGVIGMAMPDFTIEGRTPISAPARNSDREVWCVRRRSGTDETASSG
jgi:SAM-dependent methyltransferase